MACRHYATRQSSKLMLGLGGWILLFAANICDMMMSSNGHISRFTGHLCKEFTGDRCAWINGRVDNREAGDLRRHRAHYDVTEMVNNLHIFFTTDSLALGPNHNKKWQGVNRIYITCGVLMVSPPFANVTIARRKPLIPHDVLQRKIFKVSLHESYFNYFDYSNFTVWSVVCGIIIK